MEDIKEPVVQTEEKNETVVEETKTKSEEAEVKTFTQEEVNAMLAKEKLLKVGINPLIINASFVKPLDKDMLNELVNDGYDIITIEDNIINGGFGSYVSMDLYELGFKNKFKALGFENKFVPQGDVKILYSENKLDPEGIAHTIKELYK